MNRFLDPKCGDIFKSYFECATAHTPCTSAGVTDDPALQAAIAADCSSQVTAYQSCSGGM
jgi:hypothetical protein